MMWQEMKAAVVEFLESAMEYFQQQNQPVMRPIPVETKRPEEQRRRRGL